MKRKASPTKSPSKDYIYQFVISTTDWYAARASGLHRSRDRGSSWQVTYDSLGLKEVLPTLCVAAPPGPDGDAIVFAGLNGGLLRSTDNGETWQSLALPQPPSIVTCLAPSPDFARDGTLFVGTLGSGILIYKSHGKELMMWNFGLLDHGVLCLAVSPTFIEDQTLYVGVQTGLFRSLNAGQSWNEIDLPIGYEPVLSLAISPNFSEDGTLIIGTEEKGLFRSTDKDLSWQRIAEKQLVAPINSISLIPSSQKQGEEMLVLHGGELLSSSDGGNSWEHWQGGKLAQKEIAAFLTFQDSHANQALLVGYLDGEICLYE